MDATAAEIATARRTAPVVAVGRLVVKAVLALVVVALLAAAFVGLGRSSYWIDEFWTLFVADHALGAGEVVRRALSDTNPPAYFLLAHGWIRLFGDSEAATRSLSALCAVGASLAFIAGDRAAFSRAARLFGAAAGASALYWFKQSQNDRGYALAMLVLTALLTCAVAARRRSLAGEPVARGLCAGIAALGLLGAFTHYYLFIAVGLVYLGLLLGVPDRRLRATVLVSGGAILAAVLAYMRLERSHLLFTNLWFSNAPDALLTALRNAWDMVLDGPAKGAVLVLVAGALFGLLRRGRGEAAEAVSATEAPPVGDWIAGLSLAVMLGLAAAGLAVSLLVQPSFSARNLLIAAPCVWFLAAWLYDRAAASAPRAGLAFTGVAAALMVLELLPLGGRLLNRTEDWRGSAQYVSALPACRGREIPVVLPEVFGPDTPFFRRLAERDLFGWYYRGGGRLTARTRGELAASSDPALTALFEARAHGTDPCPILAWGVHDLADPQATVLARALSRRPEVDAPVTVRRFLSYRRTRGGWRPGTPAGYVFERAARPAQGG